MHVVTFGWCFFLAGVATGFTVWSALMLWVRSKQHIRVLSSLPSGKSTHYDPRWVLHVMARNNPWSEPRERILFLHHDRIEGLMKSVWSDTAEKGDAYQAARYVQRQLIAKSKRAQIKQMSSELQALISKHERLPS